jgi:hypothetical protein
MFHDETTDPKLLSLKLRKISEALRSEAKKIRQEARSARENVDKSQFTKITKNGQVLLFNQKDSEEEKIASSVSNF